MNIGFPQESVIEAESKTLLVGIGAARYEMKIGQELGLSHRLSYQGHLDVEGYSVKKAVTIVYTTGSLTTTVDADKTKAYFEKSDNYDAVMRFIEGK